jgi:hypothetical protein
VSSRIVRSVAEIYRRVWGGWDPRMSHILRSVRHEGVKRQATGPSNELSRYELMISTEPINPGISTDVNWCLRQMCGERTNYWPTLAPLPRGSGASGVSNLQSGSGPKITDGRREFLPYFLLPFFRPTWGHTNGCRGGGTGRTWTSSGRSCAGDGRAIEKWNLPERGSATIGQSAE